ncbi:MAG: hypothetical protein KDD66_00700 [Bdellovibrionales bacterium]|nr:hypothetical protein [Bdellovibrionales bacterium]
MRIKTLCVAGLVVFCGAISACSKKPVLMDNEKFKDVGQIKAEEDIKECMQRAKDQNAIGESRAQKAGYNATRGAAAGAAGGAVTSAIWDRNIGRGVAAGAAGGATSAFIWYFFDREPDEIFRRYVDICLRQKGYQPLGWGVR